MTTSTSISRHAPEGRAASSDEARFRASFEHAAVGMAHVGLDGRWLLVNRKLCDILGYEPEELMAMRFQDVTHPDDLDQDLALVEDILAGRRDSYALERRYVRRDGSLVWIQLSVATLTGAGGDIDCFISVIEDISARKEAEAALRRAGAELEQRVAERTAELQASEAHIREIVATVPGVLYQWYVRRNGDTGFYYHSRRQGEEGDKPDWATVFHPDDRAAMLASIQKAVAAQEPWFFEGRTIDSHGQTHWIRTHSHPVRITADEIVYTGFIIDVTEEHATKQALADNERRYRALVDGSLQGILVQRVQDGFRPVFANDIAAALFGYATAAELLAEESCAHLLPVPVQQELAESWRRLAAGEIDGVHVRLPHLRRNGSEFWVELMARAVDWDGAPALQMTLVDVTERQRLEMERERQATTDSLTGLLNRRQFHVLAEQEIRRHKRFPHSLTLLMIDVDHFKRINDSHGHAAGDAVLRAVAGLIKEALRESDIVARLGGEEFAALLLSADEAKACEIAERMRAACERTVLAVDGADIRATISIGVSEWRLDEHTLDDTLRRADRALYNAKHGGRNRVSRHIGDD